MVLPIPVAPVISVLPMHQEAAHANDFRRLRGAQYGIL